MSQWKFRNFLVEYMQYLAILLTYCDRLDTWIPLVQTILPLELSL